MQASRGFRWALFAILLWPGRGLTQSPDYKGLHSLLIKFYGYQRAGDKSLDNKNPWYKTAPYPHSQDNDGGKDLSGGWYDAGDFVKFGLPLGFSAYCLLKGYDVFPRAYDDADSWDYRGAPDGIPDILGEVKVAADYLMKAVESEARVVVDVGNGAADHQALSESGYANSQRTSPRQVYAAAGADVAGLYAATLALMSKLYKPHDSVYAGKCLAKAREAFKFGLSNPRLATQQNNGEYYKTATFEDKMACAAVELYRASGEADFLAQARKFQGKVVSHYFVLGYANVGDLSAFELRRLGETGVEGAWLADVNLSIRRVVAAANASPLIKGAYINSDWGTARNAACAAFSAGLAFMVTGESQYLDFARSQVHWVAGLAPFSQSYVVGFGANAPTAPHHRNDVSLGRSTGLRLKGGVVSGPTPTGAFDASKPENSAWAFNGANADNYKNTEVALDYNAGMVGAVAFLRDYGNPPAGLVRIAKALGAAPDNADLNIGPVALSAVLETPQAWKLALTGRNSQARKTFAGSGTAVSAAWRGEAEQGSFLAGEGVDVVLDIPNIASYHLLRSRTSLFIKSLPKEAFRPADVVVDDFEDGDMGNKIAGHWEIFTDQGQGGTSFANPPAAGPALLTATGGESGSKAVTVRLVGGAGAPHPHVGLRTTFNADGTPMSLGPALSLVFDVQGEVNAAFRVELEQAGIADGAYFGKDIILANAEFNRVRIALTSQSLAQPAWKASPGALNLGNVSSLRFTYYGASNIRLTLDNLRIEGLQIGNAALRPLPFSDRSGVGGLSAARDRLTYVFTPLGGAQGIWRAEITDMFGRSLAKQSFPVPGGGRKVEWRKLHLAPGLHFLRHAGAGWESTARFVVP
jgi:endoglucanase